DINNEVVRRDSGVLGARTRSADGSAEPLGDVLNGELNVVHDPAQRNLVVEGGRGLAVVAFARVIEGGRAIGGRVLRGSWWGDAVGPGRASGLGPSIASTF